MATRTLTKFDQVKAVMRSDEAVTRFAEVVGNQNARAYISSVLLAVANNDALQDCTPQSIMTSAMRAATLRLTVDPSLGQAHIVPFKGAATFVIGYKGLEQLALRTGKYRYINVATIWQGQTVVENQLKGVHSIQGLPTERIPIGYMLYFELRDGYAKTFYMTVEEIAAHAERYSKSFGLKSSPWTTHFPEMCKKTVMRLGLSRWGYFDPNDAMMLTATDDQEPEVINAEWMDKAVQDEQERPQKNEGQLMQELGIEDKQPPAPANGNGHERKPEFPEPKAALNFTASNGKRLGDMTVDELTVLKEKCEATARNRRGEPWQKSYDAVCTVLDWRTRPIDAAQPQ